MILVKNLFYPFYLPNYRYLDTNDYKYSFFNELSHHTAVTCNESSLLVLYNHRVVLAVEWSESSGHESSCSGHFTFWKAVHSTYCLQSCVDPLVVLIEVEEEMFLIQGVSVVFSDGILARSVWFYRWKKVTNYRECWAHEWWNCTFILPNG